MTAELATGPIIESEPVRGWRAPTKAGRGFWARRRASDAKASEVDARVSRRRSLDDTRM